MTTKLTLSVDPAVVSRAKRYAAKQGVSVSWLVETYLASVSRPDLPTERSREASPFNESRSASPGQTPAGSRD
jgi:hypothetical protein